MNLLGTFSSMLEEALEHVLNAQTTKISKADRLALEACITLEELEAATLSMARNKVLGKDGILIEFFTTLWEEICLILLVVLIEGLAKGEMHQQLPIGVIILLVKRGDQLLVGNKHGLTLLNCVL